MRQEFGKLHPRLTGPPEFERGSQQLSGLSVEMDFHLTVIRLVVAACEFRFGIEEVDLTRTSVLKEADHGLGPRPVVWGARGQGRGRCGALRQKMGQRKAA